MICRALRRALLKFFDRSAMLLTRRLALLGLLCPPSSLRLKLANILVPTLVLTWVGVRRVLVASLASALAPNFHCSVPCPGVLLWGLVAHGGLAHAQRCGPKVCRTLTPKRFVWISET